MLPANPFATLNYMLPVTPDASALAENIRRSVATVFVGKDSSVRTLLTGFFAGLHVLIEDIPGVGKTTLARTLARSTGLDFGRIQFTPDLLPGDILGMSVWDNGLRDFRFREGAIMHQFVLADEINRASPRTQTALLEAMQEDAVTVDGKTYLLPSPFFVLATQNPVSFAGTFQLPEAEADRFGLSFSLGYPAQRHEQEILHRFRVDSPEEHLVSVAAPEDILAIRMKVREVHVDLKISDYLVRIAAATRQSAYLRLGMSPRATQHLLLASQAEALLSDRDFVIPEDVQCAAPHVLRHRLYLTAEARMENLTPDGLIARIMEGVPAPSGFAR